MLLHSLWVIPAAVLVLLVFLWFRAGRDLHYMMRVLVHRDSSTSDYQWKRSAPVSATAGCPTSM